MELFDAVLVEAVKEAYLSKQNNNLHQISFLHLEVVEALKPLGFNFKIEKRLFGLDIDVLFYEADGSVAVGALEIHGYQHFLRNTQTITGDSFLKQKIMERIMGSDNYFVVEIFNWEIIAKENRTTFLADLLRGFGKRMAKDKPNN